MNYFTFKMLLSLKGEVDKGPRSNTGQCLCCTHKYVSCFQKKGKKKTKTMVAKARLIFLVRLLPFPTLCYDVVMVVDLSLRPWFMLSIWE